eukprot:TRINITY_DN16566_c0_g1_i1.p1 TRINITY_DN16566_c0_g1~~TRINITY_DN16566_c0_g1_i1.p1  ORF type:complete len:588 (+),score=143.85 TRINITY_DN16566_c0_g1_i1:47-1810(+)
MSLHNAFEDLTKKGARAGGVRKKKENGVKRCSKLKKQAFDYFMVLDFEATCEKDDRLYQHEIIEFPVVVVDAKTCEVVNKFHSYVRPTLNPDLTDFCTRLTGITQDQVDPSPTLDEVLKKVHSWLDTIGMLDPKVRFTFATDGPWDFRDFFWAHAIDKQRCVAAHYPYYESWVDIRAHFSELTKQRVNVNGMLRYFGLKFEGRPHSGIDDTMNIARILVELLHAGVVFQSDGHAPAKSVTAHMARVDPAFKEKPKERAKQIFNYLVPINLASAKDAKSGDGSPVPFITTYEACIVDTATSEIVAEFARHPATLSELDAAIVAANAWLSQHGLFNEGVRFSFVAHGHKPFEDLLWTNCVNSLKAVTTSYPYYRSWCDVLGAYTNHTGVKQTLGDICEAIETKETGVLGQVTAAVRYLMDNGTVFNCSGSVNKLILINHHARIKKKGVQDLAHIIAYGVDRKGSAHDIGAYLIDVAEKKIIDTYTGTHSEPALEPFLKWAAAYPDACGAAFGRTAPRLAALTPNPPLLLTRTIEISRILTYGAFNLSGSAAAVLKALKLSTEMDYSRATAAIIIKMLQNNVRVEANTGC